MDARSWPRGYWWVRTHKLITCYWWRTTHLKHHLRLSTLTTSISFCLCHRGKEEYEAGAIFNTGDVHKQPRITRFQRATVWSPEINMSKWRCSLTTHSRHQHALLPLTPFLITVIAKVSLCLNGLILLSQELLWNHAFLTRRAECEQPLRKYDQTNVLDKEC